MASKNYVIIKGVAYPIATKTQQKATKTKSVESPLNKLKRFMKKQGYEVTNVEKNVPYTRKDGKVLNCMRATFTNKKSYLISTKTFWKEQK